MLDTYRNESGDETPETERWPQASAPGEPIPETPAPPTVPLRAEEAPVTPASSYGAGYDAGYYNSAYTPNYGATPPYTPWEPPAPPRRPRRWGGALLALALLIALVIGGAAGAVIALHSVGSTTVSGSTIVLGAKSAPAISASSSTTSLQQSVEAVAKAVKPSVVEVTSTGAGAGEAIGSGDILTADGYIVTNDHVVQGFSNFTVTLSNGVNQQAQLIGQDAQDDLAVLKISATNLTPIAIGDSSKLATGEFNVVVGSPLGLQNSVSFGVVSALNRSASEAPSGPAGELTGLIQTSAPFNPGNSGGALVNLQGQLIGIPTLTATNPETGGSANSIGYAIPSNRVEYVAQQLIAHGGLTSSGQGFIGIQAQDVTPQLAAANGLSVQNGVLVAGFTNDAAGQSPAQQAGLQVGDVITAINGTTVNSNSDLASALLSDAPGTQVSLTIVRGANQQTVTITLGERPINTQG